MKVSLNMIKQLAELELPPVDELVTRVNAQLGGVEGIIDLGAKYKDAKIARVVECEKHPNADKLSVCKIDAGTEELIQVVCGAPNVHTDMWAVWLPPESIVPSTFDDTEPFVLGARELRGILSQGMLASSKELGLGDDHSGIVEINESDLLPPGDLLKKIDQKNLSRDVTLKPGSSFAELFALNDTIIDIENKMFTHRPDLFGQIGVAREISAILQGVTKPEDGSQDTRFENLEMYWRLPQFDSASELMLEVFNEAQDAVPRIMFVALDNVEIKQSPLWLKAQLVAMGGKPINNVVDATNYIMLMTAQPTHAYDYDKIRGSKIGVRMAEEDEEITLLNGKNYQLTTEDIVVADNEGAIGLAGIMGGGNSEVSADTKKIILEVGTFDMYAVRKSSMRHGVFTDALTRFNKGQSPLQNSRVLAMLMSCVKSVSNAAQASDVYDKADRDWTREDSVHPALTVGTDFINERLGSSLTGEQMGNLLRGVNFSYGVSDDVEGAVVYNAPFWRTDIELPEDIVEEVGRLYGFDKLPRELPLGSIKPANKNVSLETKERLRTSLSSMGCNEILTYSFVHENVIKRSTQNVEKAYKLSNALSPDLQYYRMSLMPSLLDKIHANIKAGYEKFTIFEIGKSHHKDAIDAEGLPIEFGRLAGVYAAKKAEDGAAYFRIKRIVSELCNDMGVSNVRYEKLSDFDYGQHDALRQLAAPFEEKRAAMLWIDDKFYGVVGEFKPEVAKGFKLPVNCAGFEIFMSLFEKNSSKKSYKPLSRFPGVYQDITLSMSNNISYSQIYEDLEKAFKIHDGSEFDIRLTPLSIYRSQSGDKEKNISWRVNIISHTKTLTDKDVSRIIEHAAQSVAQKYQASIV